LATCLIWLATAALFRYSSLASIVAALLAPVAYALGGGEVWFVSKSIALGVVVMSLLLLYRHAENINRLIKGTESKLGKKAVAAPPAAPVTPVHQAHHAHHGHQAGRKTQRGHEHKGDHKV